MRQTFLAAICRESRLLFIGLRCKKDDNKYNTKWNAANIVELVCSPYLLRGLQQQSIYLSAVNIFLSIRAFLENSPILVALDEESSLHPPSKLM